MCRTAAESVLFGCLHVVTMMTVRWQSRRTIVPCAHAYVMFCGFFASMEFLQAAQWVIGVQRDESAANLLLTIGAYVLIHLQPVLFAAIGAIFVDNRRYFLPLLLSVVAFVAACANLRFDAVAVAGMNYGAHTCTRAGPNGHLLWQFAIRHIHLQPTYWYYLASIGTCLLGYRREAETWNRLGWTLGSGWLASLLLAWLVVGSNGELPAFWCLLSITADVPILAVVLASAKS